MALIKIRITDFLLPTERILYQRLPKNQWSTKAPSNGRINFNPFAFGWILIISSVFTLALVPNITQTLDLTFFIILIAIEIFSIGIAIRPAFLYKAENSEIIITNQRVLIYPSPYAEKNRPRIINLNEINGEIKIRQNKSSNIGSIWIPGPHWDWFKFAREAQRMRAAQATPIIIPPAIEHIENPITVHKILIKAIEDGKKLKWKFS